MIWVLFYIFSTVVFGAGAFVVWRGLSGALHSGAGMLQKITGGAVAAIGVLIALGALTVVDRSGSYPERQKASECRERLEEIYFRIKSYAKDHDGKMPESLREMVDGGYLIERDLVCPAREKVSESGEGGVEGGTYYYDYRKASGLSGEEIMVFDSVPHDVPHKVFRFLAAPRYNVLLSNGEVDAMEKAELDKRLAGDDS